MSEFSSVRLARVVASIAIGFGFLPAPSRRPPQLDRFLTATPS